MSLLETRLKKDRQMQEDAEAKVEGLAAIRPTAEEHQKVDTIINSVSQQFSSRIAEEGITPGIRTEITAQVEKEVQAVSTDYEERSRIRKLVLTSMFGLGPLELYMQPFSTATDIIVHRYDHICIEDHKGVRRIAAEFNSETHLRNVIQRIVQQVGRQINLTSPAVDAKLPDGSRIHATLPPITPDGATLTIRRFNTQKLEPEDYLRLGTLNEPMLDFLRCAVIGKLSLLVSGGTGSGKTTLLNMLSGFIPEHELIVTIEDNCELQLRQPNVRRMEARPATGDFSAIDIQELVRHSLRMRPDRIIVGEVRDGSVVDMLSAMSTGHEGSMSTIHADSPRALADSRLPTLFSQYQGGSLSRETQTYMTAEAVQLIIQIAREPDHSRKVTHITAVDGLDEAGIRLIDLFCYDRKRGVFEQVGCLPQSIIQRLENQNVSVPDSFGKGQQQQ